eukprot:NODE_360_length_2883_cov_20.402899_g305_i0.p1 GENE.NODE_360_length_2883_cov_20.402899_g305_i0~~NODE_360_length_2883_cov_20.402899_g305_i0.p1  ORF type:complete len:390 (-),score=43.98 NODE_360_length_2883_cov_20.402899_g305_i0:1297-2466(-)
MFINNSADHSNDDNLGDFIGGGGNGGAIISEINSKGNISGTIFRNNEAIMGGAILLSSNSKIYFNNATFENNFGRFGGAIYTSTSFLSTNMSFKRNIASYYGGAIFFSDASLVRNSSVGGAIGMFINNTAGHYGNDAASPPVKIIINPTVPYLNVLFNGTMYDYFDNIINPSNETIKIDTDPVITYGVINPRTDPNNLNNICQRTERITFSGDNFYFTYPYQYAPLSIFDGDTPIYYGVKLAVSSQWGCSIFDYNVSLIQCPPGYNYSIISNVPYCLKCDLGSYKLSSGWTKCHICPKDKTTLCSSDNIQLLPGYWASPVTDVGSVSIYRCPNKRQCKGGHYLNPCDDLKNVSSPLCGGCKNDYRLMWYFEWQDISLNLTVSHKVFKIG